MVANMVGRRCHQAIFNSTGLVLSIGLIAILFSINIVFAQGETASHEGEEKPFLQPYSPAATNKILDASLKPNSIKSNKVKGVGRSYKVGVASSKNILGFYQGTQQASKVQQARPNITTAGKALAIEAYNQYGSGVYGSFLDGYLLKSLNDKKSSGNKNSEGWHCR
jgi:hypothetical protein